MKKEIVFLSGRIDSVNAPQTEQDILRKLEGKEVETLVFDGKDLFYISSAGLRMILRIKKIYEDLSIINVSAEVYAILEMTGFTEIIHVQKAYRELSVEGCEIIGEGAEGIIYRIDQDHVVKLFKYAEDETEILSGQEAARLAFILGIPTAISFDIVRIGDKFGAVFELLKARSFSEILKEEPEKTDWCIREYIDVLKKIHTTQVPSEKLPSAKERFLGYLSRMKGDLSENGGNKLEELLRALPEPGTMVHGDYHVKNIVLVGDEVLLIDMETVSVGHPVFDLAMMYAAYIGFSEYNPERVKTFQGFSAKTAREFWQKSLQAYLGTGDKEILKEVENKARIAAYIRLIEWGGRHLDLTSPDGTAERNRWIQELEQLLEKADSLDFDTEL